MPVAAVAILLLQITCVVHVFRTGRNPMWIALVIFVPLIGCIAYFIVEILPTLGQGRTVRHVASRMDRAINAKRDYQTLVAAVEELPTPHNKHLLAEELIRRGETSRARALYESALAPPYEHDPILMMGLARASFLEGDADGALQTLDRLQKENPGYQSQDGHLLYARALTLAGRPSEAMAEYQNLVSYYAGQEARARYAILLEEAGRTGEARELFDVIRRAVERGNKDYRRNQREWYELAKSHLSDATAH